MDGNWEDAAESSRTGDINGTDLDSTKVGNHGDSDVTAYALQYSGSWYGSTTCEDPDGSVCHHWHVRFNKAARQYTQAERKSLTCHEFGHTAGLGDHDEHQNDPSCIETPHWHNSFNAHDKNHINGYY